MTVGLQVWDSSGTLVFDTTTAKGGCLADVVSNTTSAQVKNYPAFAGYTAVVVDIFGFDYVSVSISYTSGYPSITFPAYPGAGLLFWAVYMI